MPAVYCRRALITAVSTILSTQQVMAADEPLSPIQVTATRTAQTVDDTQASVTVITREDIENSPAQSIDEVLRSVPGIDISRNGGYGKSTSVFIRGTNSGHALILIDGVRAASATTGGFAWSQFSLDNIERIEVVRGPRAALYGSDAIGGVIQIFTRRADTTSLKLTGGSHRTREASITTAGGEDWRYHLEAGRKITDGIPSTIATTEEHGFSNSHASLGIDGNLSEENKLKLNLNHSEGLNQLDPTTGDIRFTNQVASVKLTRSADPRWMQQFLLGYTLDESQSFSPTIPSTITTKRYSAGWQNDIDSSAGLSTVGVDFWQDNATKNNGGVIDERIENKALFIQHQYYNGDFGDLSASARVDSHSEFGSHETWSLGWSKEVNNTRYILSYGTAFKAPTINDLYWPTSTSTFFGDTYTSQGNPDLKPEESQTLELGFRHKLSSRSRYELSLYETRLDNLIDWQTTQTGPSQYLTEPSNVDKATIRGMELLAATQVTDWELSGSFTLLDAIDDATGTQLDRRPREKLNLKASWKGDGKRFNVEMIAAGSRKDRGGSVELDGYQIVNLAYQSDYNRQATTRVRIENLFNEEYILASSFSGNYNTVGLSMFIDFIYHFGQ